MKEMIKRSVVYVFAGAIAMSAPVFANSHAPEEKAAAKAKAAIGEPGAEVEKTADDLVETLKAGAKDAKKSAGEATEGTKTSVEGSDILTGKLPEKEDAKEHPAKGKEHPAKGQEHPAKADAAMSDASIDDLTGQLESAAAEQDDPELKSLAGEWGGKVSALGAALGDNPQVKGYLSSAMQGVLGNNAPAALAAMQQLKGLDLSGEKMDLVKQVTNLGGAYLMQKNFGGMEGSKETVSKVVGALKQGNYMEVAAPLKDLASGDGLSDEQKDLATSMLASYVPGADAAKGMLKKIKGDDSGN